MYPDTKKGGGDGTAANACTMPAMCGEGNGSLPSCAPLSVPYVPFQEMGSKRYDQREALQNGTLFPGLDLPFHLKAEPGKIANGPMAELQALEFVLVELGEYLDTHQDDTEAFQLYQKYAALEEEGRERYEAMYGPLQQASAANGTNWAQWLSDPWPWNYKGKE